MHTKPHLEMVLEPRKPRQHLFLPLLSLQEDANPSHTNSLLPRVSMNSVYRPEIVHLVRTLNIAESKYLPLAQSAPHIDLEQRYSGEMGLSWNGMVLAMSCMIPSEMCCLLKGDREYLGSGDFARRGLDGSCERCGTDEEFGVGEVIIYGYRSIFAP